jgi:hypothetical protein
MLSLFSLPNIAPSPPMSSQQGTHHDIITEPPPAYAATSEITHSNLPSARQLPSPTCTARTSETAPPIDLKNQLWDPLDDVKEHLQLLEVFRLLKLHVEVHQSGVTTSLSPTE